MADLDWIHALPGRKIFIKGNHDLWWTSVNKLNKLYTDGTMQFLQCNAQILEVPANAKVRGPVGVWMRRKHPCIVISKPARYAVKRLAICGSRGWNCPGTDVFSAHDRKIYDRESATAQMSLDDAKIEAPMSPRSTAFSAKRCIRPRTQKL